MAPGFREDTTEELEGVIDTLLSTCIDTGELHEPDDFERQSYFTHECVECRHSVGPQQLAAAEKVLDAAGVLEADSYDGVREHAMKEGIRP